MRAISVTEFATMSAAKLRLTEAQYLFEQFKAVRNAEPNHGLFLLTVYFDSLLFCLISIEEMVDTATKSTLRQIDSFRFFKALRNITSHHSVLSGIHGKFDRPISRNISVHMGGQAEFSEQFFLLPDKLRTIFDSVEKERQREKPNLDAARVYLSTLETSGKQIMLVDLVENAIADIERHIV